MQHISIIIIIGQLYWGLIAENVYVWRGCALCACACTLIYMYACSLGRWQEIYTPPAHLQQDERKDEQRKQRVCVAVGGAHVQIEQIAEPCGQGPCLFGVPCPVVTPCLFGPQGAHHHAKGQETPSDAHKAVADAQFLVVCRCFPEP